MRSIGNRRSARSVLALGVWVVLGAACEFKGQAGGSEPAADGQTWVPIPVSMRIYPSTRFVRQAGEAVLEARIELFDDMGDSIKGAGTLRFELFAADDGNTAERLYRWEVDARTLERQRKFYDPVTRGYLFRLRLDDISIVRQQTMLRVTMTLAHDCRIETSGLIKTDW